MPPTGCGHWWTWGLPPQRRLRERYRLQIEVPKNELVKINGHWRALDYLDDNVRLAHRGHGELTDPHFRYLRLVGSTRGVTGIAESLAAVFA
jgi:hypothetical protein